MTTQLAANLLTAAKGRPVLVRTWTKDQFHAGRAILRGVSGSRVIIKPMAHGGRDEYVRPECVEPWKSKLPTDLIPILEKHQ